MNTIKISVWFLCLILILPAFAHDPEEKEVILIGTAHALDMEEEIRRKIIELRPDAIAVELNEDSFNSLIRWSIWSGKICIEDIGKDDVVPKNNSLEKTYILAQDLIWTHGAMDMLAGIVTACELNIPVYPIDMPEDELSSISRDLDLRTLLVVFRGFIELAKETMGTNFTLLFNIFLMALAGVSRNIIAFWINYIPIGKMLVQIVLDISFLTSFLLHPISAIRYYGPFLSYVGLLPILFPIILIILLLLNFPLMIPQRIEIIRTLYDPAKLEGRENYMAERIVAMSEKYNRIVVITGAAHLSGLQEKIGENDIQIRTIYFTEICKS